MNGIYQYRDLETNEIVYIGKDSYIDKNARRNDHMFPSKYDSQIFNKVLQNNPDRYQYEVIYVGDFDRDMLNILEINSIAEENPKFNFTKGGDGMLGHIPSDETRRKMSNSLLEHEVSKRTRDKISKARKGQHNSPSTEFKKGVHSSPETEFKKGMINNNGENNPCWKPYARIIRNGFSSQGKQIYSIKFNGKILKNSIHVHKLYKWFGKQYPNEFIMFIPN